MTIVGIDPGSNTGIAVFEDGKLVELTTIEPVEIAEWISVNKPYAVVFEDSRKTSYVFTTSKNVSVAKTMARHVGEIDAWCKLIESICQKAGVQCFGISPLQKGKKLDAGQFCKATGWTGITNQHERDAAMCAWGYRHWKGEVA